MLIRSNTVVEAPVYVEPEPRRVTDTNWVENKDGSVTVTHRQEISDTLNYAEMLKGMSKNGWSNDREFQHLAHLPAILIWHCQRTHPEWFEAEPSQAGMLVLRQSEFENWLKTDPVAKQFLVAEDHLVLPGSGKGLQIIVK